MKRAAAIVVVTSLYAYASACCGVAPNGQPVKFGDQSNIIVWNPETKTEHFVRNAEFDSAAKDFGFIAATPEVPKLSEADKEAFDRLASLKPPSLGCSGAPTDANTPAAAAEKVDVLQDVEVGKYHATTVRSDDASAMANYLKQNGYASNPDTDEWIRFYTTKNWVFTAFKVRGGPEGKTATGVIRMSFKTEEPFNPYYVPSSNSGETGVLKLFFVSDGTYSATVGHDKPWVPQSWNAAMHEDFVPQFAGFLKLPTTDLPKNPTITYFEKYSWLEGAKDDLYFHRDSALGKMAFGGVVVLGAGLWWFTRSRRAKMIA